MRNIGLIPALVALLLSAVVAEASSIHKFLTASALGEEAVRILKQSDLHGLLSLQSRERDGVVEISTVFGEFADDSTLSVETSISSNASYAGLMKFRGQRGERQVSIVNIDGEGWRLNVGCLRTETLHPCQHPTF